MSGRLSNKVALVTGGSRGIGRAVALAFASQGAALVGVHYASNRSAADATVRDIEALGARAVAIGADLRDGKAAADSIAAQFRAAALAATGEAGLDILVNNAGIAVAAPLALTDEATFDDLMTVNFKAPFFLIQALANDIRLTLALAPDFASRGITVNTVMPGVTETDMNADWLATDARAGAEAMSVFSRLGQPEDVADVIAVVASNDARWTTGQSIDATGGARI
jgi:3-oxoacyl-[acyl-carrier protein] reductase